MVFASTVLIKYFCILISNLPNKCRSKMFLKSCYCLLRLNEIFWKSGPKNKLLRGQIRRKIYNLRFVYLTCFFTNFRSYWVRCPFFTPSELRINKIRPWLQVPQTSKRQLPLPSKTQSERFKGGHPHMNKEYGQKKFLQIELFYLNMSNIKIWQIYPKHGSSDGRALDSRPRGPGFESHWILWDHF